MKTRIDFVLRLALVLAVVGTTLTMAQRPPTGDAVPPHRLQGPCDIYAAAGDSCVAAHSTTRALYATYNGPLYQVLRQSDGKTLDIGVVQAAASPGSDPGGYADAAAQDKFCAGTYCWISMIYDQSPKHNDLIQAPRGGFSGPALGGFNTLPIADMAPITIMGHKLTLALEIGDVSRFQSVKQAVSYCGLCSAERSSADKLVRMPISKQRNKHIQQVLVEAAKLAPRYSHELALVYDRERQ